MASTTGQHITRNALVHRRSSLQSMGPRSIPNVPTKILEQRPENMDQTFHSRSTRMASHRCPMNRETVLTKLHQLLDQGEPLLTTFPQKHEDDYLLELPTSISEEMRLYAHEVSYRSGWDHEAYTKWLQGKLFNTADLLELTRVCEAGLSGWRAIGALRSP